ncbi:DUF2493 domain-containing protein [Blautia producta]|uniref:DUF2493 domain-containing protein n=1 Tax=Blautia producta TaxID=33035 RepID=UPI003564B4B2
MESQNSKAAAITPSYWDGGDYRCVVAGCRNFKDYSLVERVMMHKLEVFGQRLIIISGGAQGADALGERFAEEHQLRIERYPADWDKYGRAAGPIRNEQMAQAAHMVVVFWDGKSKGTESMIKMACKYGREMQIVRTDRKVFRNLEVKV